MGDLLRPARDRFRPDIIITDAGSTKTGVEQRVLEALEGFGHFVGAHPMAGSEKTGVAYARADLYEGATCAITETKRTDNSALDVIERLWSAVGAHIVRLSPEEHDRIVARTSHLPHMAAVALVQVLASLEDPLVRDFIGEGFRDTTRIAAGDETLWRDICLDNSRELANALRDYRDSINRILRAVDENDGEFLKGLMAHIRRIREGMG
jgi:prephenate dehydrogenase